MNVASTGIFRSGCSIENAARAYGLPDAELFQTVDLFEKRNIAQVTQCIHALGRHVSPSRMYVDSDEDGVSSSSSSCFRHKRRTSADRRWVRRCPMRMLENSPRINSALDRTWSVCWTMAWTKVLVKQVKTSAFPVIFKRTSAFVSSCCGCIYSLAAFASK